MRTVLAAVAAALALAAPAHAGTLAQGRLGNNVEDLTLVTAGPFASQVAALDGYDVVAVPMEGRRTAPAKLFDIKALGPRANPSGLVYDPVARQFLVGEQARPLDLLVAAEDGTPLPPRHIEYAPGLTPPPIGGVEGIAYLPFSSAFPDRIARLVAVVPTFAMQIEILDRSGVVERQIPLQAPLDTYCTGLAWSDDGYFVVSCADDRIWAVDAGGSVRGSAPLVELPEIVDFEGLVQLPDRRWAAADYVDGRILAFGRAFDRDPVRDRSIRVGVGLSRPFDAAWDPVTQTWLMFGLDRDHAVNELASVAPDLRSRTVLFASDFTVGLTLLGDGTLATCDAFSRRLLILRRDGSLAQAIGLTAAGIPNRCIGVAYVPATDEFALVVRRSANRIWMLSRSGTLDRSFPVAAAFPVLSSNPDAADRFFAWSELGLTTYDAFGAAYGTEQLPLAGLVAPGFAAGPGGSFALLDPHSSEVAIQSR